MKKVYLLSFVVVMMACSKDDPKPSLADILTTPAHGWVRTSTIVTVAGVQSDVFNDPTFTPACDKDDAAVFLSDGTYQIVSTVKCNSFEPTILDAGTWSVSDNDTKLTITIASSINTATIIEADETHVKAKMTLTFSGVALAAVVTMVPK
jgi:hypothetical protein